MRSDQHRHCSECGGLVKKRFLRILLLNGPPLKLRPPGHEHLHVIEALGEVEEQPPVQGRRRHRAGT